MRSRTRIAVALTLAACFVTTALAERLAVPRPMELGHLSFAVPMSSANAPLSSGNLNKIAAGSGWVTSNFEATIFGTEPYWCDTELIAVMGTLIANKAKPVTEKITAKSSDGTVVYTDSAALTPGEGSLNTEGFVVGALAPDVYKVVHKFKQGDTVVGQSFYFYVTNNLINPGYCQAPLCQYE